jgi:heme exporter protein D
MNWHSASEFFAMGGRGFYVWGAYGVSFVLIALELWLLRRRRTQTLARLHRLQQLESPR